MDDAALVRFIDGQSDLVERSVIESHVLRCGACLAKVSELRRISTRFHSALLSFDSPLTIPPFDSVRNAKRSYSRRDYTPSIGWKRIAYAAAIALVLLGTLAPPVRALVASLLSNFRKVEETTPSRPAGPEASALTHSLIEFQPQGNSLTVDFEAVDRAAVVFITAHPANRVKLLSTAGATDDVTVLPNGLRVRTPDGHKKSYRLIVPSELQSLIIRVSGKSVFVTTGDDLKYGERQIQLLRESG